MTTVAMPRPSRAGLLLRAFRPPLGDARFWIVQLLVILIALFHEFADAHVVVLPIGIPRFAAVALFMVPIVYAALNFGLTGSFATAVWVTAVSIPDFFLIDGPEDHWVDGIQLAIIDTVAIFVGLRVEEERRARLNAEVAQARAAAYAAKVIEAQEDERRRIAHELHDDPLQALIHVARRLEGKPELEELRAHTESVIASLRALAHGLRPPSLDDLGMVASIRRLVQDCGARAEIEVEFSSTGSERRLPPNVELTVFRIAQEALSNVERHAAARSLRAQIVFARDAVILRVADDGVGFDPARPSPRPDSLGLLGMEERASLMGGRVRVSSAEGRGTTVEAKLPAGAPPR